MKRIRIAFFDIDGTLLDFSTKNPSLKMKETLVRLKDNGIILCIATGRSPLTLPDFARSGFDAHMTFNGSFCYDTDGEIYSNPLPADDIRLIVDNAAAIGRPVSIATKDRFAANGVDEDLKAYYGISGFPIKASEDFDSIIANEKIFQIMMGCYEREYSAVMKGVRHAKIAAWWDRAVDIIPAEGGKGNAVRKILEYYGLDESDAIAFGDGNNDIEMLQTAGTGVAMGNGSSELKAIADDVCGTAVEDGIYHYCLEHGLI